MLNVRNTLGLNGYRDPRAVVFGITLAVAAIVVLATNVRAQEAADFELFGTVVDAETGQLLQGAWVGLTGTDWGSITNDDGRFRIPDVSPGGLALTIEQLGYETLEWTGVVSDGDDQLRIALRSRPILLEGLTVVTDRFRSRRNAAATSVRAYNTGDLVSGTALTALDFVRDWTGALLVGCNGRRGSSCLHIRGRAVEPVVYIAEAPVLGGLDQLQSFAPWEFYMIEVFAGGGHIRAYTPRFMERAAENRLLPIALAN